MASSPPPHPLRVSIIGGGPGGLTLARILQETTSPSELQVIVYERDESRAARSQGGSLDLHDDTGLRALRTGGLIERFKKLARPEGDMTRVYDMFSVLRHDEEPADIDKDAEPTGRPEIDRTDLRDLLIDSIKPDTIRWNHHLLSLQPLSSSASGEYELTFSSGEKVVTDLVVGADGAWSRVRPLLNPKAVPEYTGLCSFDLIVTDAERRFPELSQRTGNGLAFFLGDRKSFIAQRNSHGKIKVYASLWKDEDWMDQFKGQETKVLREKIIENFPGYDDKVLDYVRAADDDIVTRKLYVLPLSCYNFPSHASLTLLGDAAHVMSPFAGEGVNLAMADAADLASQLSQFLSSRSKSNSQTTLQSVLHAYSKDMFKRALVAGKESAENLVACHDDDAVEFLSRVMAFYKGVTVSALLGFVPWFIWRTIRRFFASIF